MIRGKNIMAKLSKRIKLVIFKNAFWLLRQKHFLDKIERKNLLSLDERYAYAQSILSRYHKSAKINVLSTGIEQLPSDLKGCIFYGNHQGAEDCPAILHTLKDFTTSYLIDADTAKKGYMKYVLHLLKAKPLDMEDLRSQVQIYHEMADEIEQEGRRFIIFPEAGYQNNHNSLIDFHTPCFMPAIKSHCPIIPFCLYDSWKAFEDKTLKPITVQCHILKPIYYEEYKGMTKQDLAKLVKEKIQEKLDELSSKTDK